MPNESSARRVGSQINSALRRGGAISAGIAGRAVKTAVQPIVPLVGPLAAAIGNQGSRVAARDFVEGVVGVPAAPAAKKAAPKAQPKAAPAAAQAPKVSDRDRTIAAINAALNTPMTLRETQAVVGLLPAATKTTQKDQLIGATAQLSQQMYAQQIAQATELAKTDPVGAKEMTAKATDAYFQRNAALTGFNPLQLAQASLIDQDPE